MKTKPLKTLTIFGQDRLSRIPDKPFNVVVGGASRGGTSAVAAVMRRIGLNMGTNLHETTHEDTDFADFLNYSKFEYQEWRDLVVSRLAKYDGWSIKLPGAFRMLHVFEDTLPNPLYVIVIRNPFAVARSLVNRDETYGNDMLDYLRGYSHAIEMYGDCLRNIGVVRGAFAICAYEDIMSKPTEFVREFSQLCRITLVDEQVASAAQIITRAGYKTVGTINTRNAGVGR